MSDISRVSLFGKLDPLAFRAVESRGFLQAARQSRMWSWSTGSIRSCNSPAPIFTSSPARSTSAPPRWHRDVTDALDQLPRGATSVSDISARVEDATERAWVWATLRFGATSIRTGHLVVAHAEDA